MKRRLCLLALALGLIIASVRESDAYGRYYNGYGRGGPGVHRYYGFGYGPYGNRGYGYGNGGYIDYGAGYGYGYGNPYGFGISVY